MVLIHTALLCEAMPIIEHFGLKKVAKNFYKNESISLCVLGVGAKKTQALAEILRCENFTKVLNIGICGAKDKSVEIGEIFCVGENLPFLKSATLECVKNPKSEIQADICDMESGEFFKICENFKVKNFCLKIVSDHLDAENLSKNFVYNLVRAKILEIKKAIFWNL